MPSLPRLLALTALVALAPAAVAKDKKPVDPTKRTCRSEVPTGSRMPKSTCHTNAEWAEIDRANAASAQSTLEGATRNGAPQ